MRRQLSCGGLLRGAAADAIFVSGSTRILSRRIDRRSRLQIPLPNRQIGVPIGL